MSVHEARIRFKVGDLELEYQGPSSYIESGLIDMFEKVLGYGGFDAKSAVQAPKSTIVLEKESVPQRVDSDISLTTLISRVGANKNADVVFMSAAHLVVCQGRSSVSRADILKNARSADGHYKESIRSNLSSYLKKLIKERRLSQYSNGAYTVPESQRQSVRDAIDD